MSDVQKTSGGKIKTATVIAATALSAYLLNFASLHGVNFETYGIPSEQIKATLEGFFVGAIAFPEHYVEVAAASIIGVRWAFRKIWSAATNPLPQQKDTP